MSFDIKRLFEGASTETKRQKKGENVTISFPKRKIVRFRDGEQLSFYEAYYKYIVQLVGSESPTVIATRLLALAKNSLAIEQRKTKTQ
jgi:phage baseplate assembly protein gpV